MAEALTPEQLAALDDALPDWAVEDGALVREVRAATFPQAIEFVVGIAAAAEEMDHHPDIDIRWRTLRLALCTHSAGSRITDLDVELARRIDAIVAG